MRYDIIRKIMLLKVDVNSDTGYRQDCPTINNYCMAIDDVVKLIQSCNLEIDDEEIDVVMKAFHEPNKNLQDKFEYGSRDEVDNG